MKWVRQRVPVYGDGVGCHRCDGVLQPLAMASERIQFHPGQASCLSTHPLVGLPELRSAPSLVPMSIGRVRISRCPSALTAAATR